MKKKFIKSALIVSSLVIATPAFADMPSTISSTGITTGTVSDINSSIPISGTSKSQLNAFAGVSTKAVSSAELNQVSGDGGVGSLVVKYGWKAGKWVASSVAIDTAIDAAKKTARKAKNYVCNKTGKAC